MGAINNNLYVVILAGGKGTRLWPLTEHLAPKQFLNIVKNDTFLNHAIRRSLYLVGPENIYIVSIKKYLKQINISLRKFKIPKANILWEPEGKNTAPAVLLAASVLHRRDPESILLICPCDHIVTGRRRFVSDIKSAVEASQLGHIVVFGVKPSRPETEYGYIKIGPRVRKHRTKVSFYRASKFVEKPAKKLASKLIKEGSYYWSSGMFMSKNGIMLEAFKNNFSVYYERIMNVGKSWSGLQKIYKEMKSISLERLIIQRSKRLVLIKSGFKWQDLGQWDLVYDALKKDKNNNAVRGDVFSLDVKNCLILGSGKKIVCLGLRDMVVINTNYGLLAADKKYLFKLKSVLNNLTGRAQEVI